ncbi:hypothetical protein MW871_15760 [Flavobacterium sp. I-SCBP12n]|uniref:Uncharacterized protein n=1 Tax=Flavobacterium pygoscelis TaxID=2893176 RepID=A0A9X1XT25_9FLAO|nr:hypothetical protein [Flavobacterium pygoscelis]MCK8143325.1 hypothetical protein [Flavobacterium pygoscelis]MCK8143347.1 hypothetical protein [Flavobacterium pygoscelis]
MRQFVEDDNQFKDGILAFDKRNKVKLYKTHNTSEDKRIYSYLILDFKLPKDIHFKDFTIEQSIEVDIIKNIKSDQSAKKAYVSPVKMPERINYINSHYFTLGLSAVCSFAFERPVVSTKNDYYNRFEVANEHELREIGVEFPRTIRGPGAKGFRIHNEIIDVWEQRLIEVVNLLDKLTLSESKEYEVSYENLMQSFRLIQLAHINKKEDFDLGFSFIIAGIEAISQIAIDKIDFSNKPDHYNEWKNLSKKNEVAKSLFEEYLKVQAYVNAEINNRDLTKRFVRFLITYTKNSDWEEVFYNELITEGLKYRILFPNEISVVPELKPNKLTEEEFSIIIKNTYTLRSEFFHMGQSLPHKRTNNSSCDRFFHIIDNIKRREELFKKMEKENRIESPFEEWTKTQDTLITFELMSNMARNSIINYIKKVLK